MVRDQWKIEQIVRIFGAPELDTKYLPPHVLVSLKDRVTDVDGLGALILYGSVVRGEASPKSDIDIFVVPMKDHDVVKIKKEITTILREIESDYDLKISFSLMMYTGEEDSYYLWETLRDGVVIYSHPAQVIPEVKSTQPHAVIAYSYAGLSEKNKKKLQRFLFDSKTGMQINKKNKMEYVRSGVLLLPLDKTKLVEEFFHNLKVKYSLIKVWI